MFHQPRSCGAFRILFLFSVPAFVVSAQTDRGTITGTVTDFDQRRCPRRAALRARNTATGAQFDTVTTATGNYTLASLIAGTYDPDQSTATHGFERYVQQGIQVEVVQTLRVDIALKVGSSTESITVTADAVLLRTERAR